MIKFKIGKYKDEVLCDMVPMQACLLLGRPWQHDRSTKHDGRTNTYSLVLNDHKYVLHPMSPSQVNDVYQRMSESREKKRCEEEHVEAESQEEEEVERKGPSIDYDYVFPKELPSGLPSLRGIEHQIDFVPGSQLPNKPAYRSNSEDTKELQIQVEELLNKDFDFGVVAEIAATNIIDELVEVSEVNIITSSTDPELTDGETEEESNVKV
ncbi:uncharacterized protein LOC125873513 [Solanum stenotomum]|uniref:uncharacterized protein LOC125873513 n=1 Tax=Solanum stenotomum TaxID=172797 RepID=UPI0020D0284C|nr:uncharacterized protein LOC125873513 [Solanum stenotomum]